MLPPSPPLAIESLTHRFGDVVALSGINMVLGAAAVHALLAKAGSGTTTLVQLICGLLTPTSGSVLVFGENPVDREPFSRSVVLAPQGKALAGRFTVRETVAAWRALFGSTLDVDDVLGGLGLAAVAGISLTELSPLEARQAGLATAVISDRPLMLLDGPTVGLDPDERRALLNSIGQIRASGRTVLFTTPTPADVEAVADQVHVLTRGQLVASGAVRSVIAEWTRSERVTTQTLVNDVDEIRSLLGGEAPLAITRLVGDGQSLLLDVDLGRGETTAERLRRDARFEDIRLQPSGLAAAFDRVCSFASEINDD